jgi:hypothetical protein
LGIDTCGADAGMSSDEDIEMAIVVHARWVGWAGNPM